jgi:hypothetical protein
MYHNTYHGKHASSFCSKFICHFGRRGAVAHHVTKEHKIVGSNPAKKLTWIVCDPMGTKGIGFKNISVKNVCFFQDKI